MGSFPFCREKALKTERGGARFSTESVFATTVITALNPNREWNQELSHLK